jgi:hypothetical protein
MVAALDRDAERAMRELNGLLAVSGELFPGPGDPLNSDLDLTAHRWLRGDREESYSDWLALILGQQADFRKILNMFSPETIGSGGHRLITREDCIPEGRTDILIRHETIGTLLVEVKTGKFPVPRAYPSSSAEISINRLATAILTPVPFVLRRSGRVCEAQR